jgi:hypothetical protein
MKAHKPEAGSEPREFTHYEMVKTLDALGNANIEVGHLRECMKKARRLIKLGEPGEAYDVLGAALAPHDEKE